MRIGKPFYPPKAERITSQAAKHATEDIMRHVAEQAGLKETERA